MPIRPSERGGAGGGGAAAEVDEVKGWKGMKKGSDGDKEGEREREIGGREKEGREEVSVLAEKMVTRGRKGKWGGE